MTRTITLELTPIEAASIVRLYNKEFASTNSIIEFMDDEERLHFLATINIFKSVVDKIKVALDNA